MTVMSSFSGLGGLLLFLRWYCAAFARQLSWLLLATRFGRAQLPSASFFLLQLTCLAKQTRRANIFSRVTLKVGGCTVIAATKKNIQIYAVLQASDNLAGFIRLAEWNYFDQLTRQQRKNRENSQIRFFCPFSVSRYRTSTTRTAALRVYGNHIHGAY